MLTLQALPPVDSLESVVTQFVTNVATALPRLLTGMLFLVLAYVGIKITLAVLRRVLDRIYPAEQDLVVDLSIVIVGIFLWFGTLLALLSIVGMEEIAASLGTATGFIGLGVAFALKEMIADTVAGVYLLRDPDFNAGDRVDTASIEGTIRRIGLRKTRLTNESGELVVVSNRDVEKRWTQKLETQD